MNHVPKAGASKSLRIPTTCGPNAHSPISEASNITTANAVASHLVDDQAAASSAKVGPTIKTERQLQRHHRNQSVVCLSDNNKKRNEAWDQGRGSFMAV